MFVFLIRGTTFRKAIPQIPFRFELNMDIRTAKVIGIVAYIDMLDGKWVIWIGPLVSRIFNSHDSSRRLTPA
jgi:hypothetical protein